MDKPDGLILDMDCTLWDDLNTYAKVGVPFVFMTNGFGHIENCYLSFDLFNDFVQYYINLTNNHK